MAYSKWALLTLFALVSAFLFGTVATRGDAARSGIFGGNGGAGGISGVISTTLTIDENRKLTGDVECLQTDNGPCIKFGRPGIKLDLNGFTMTGPANESPRENCVTAVAFPSQPADGIQSTFGEVEIEGPGVVQRMRRHGIALLGTPSEPVEEAVVRKLVSHQNCFSGIFMGSVNHSLVEEVVAARNSANSEARPCGGVCVTNSDDNRVRRSEVAGNGTTAPGTTIPGPIPNDFGIGLVGSSSRNIIEENGIGGNISGLALFPIGASTPAANLIRNNVIVGNPPIEVSADNPTTNPVGADIRDFSAPGSNTFEDNLCVTYTGDADPPPCPSLTEYAGHRNNDTAVTPAPPVVVPPVVVPPVVVPQEQPVAPAVPTTPQAAPASPPAAVAATAAAKAMVAVPSVKGMTLSMARSALAKRGCRVGRVRTAYSRVKKGVTVRQSPAAGRRVVAGTRVSVVVSRGMRRSR